MGEGKLFHPWRIPCSLGAGDPVSLGRFLFHEGGFNFFGFRFHGHGSGFFGLPCGEGIRSMEEEIYSSRAFLFSRGFSET